MDIEKIIKERHSVRKYLDKPIEKEKVDKLNKLIDKINKENELNIQLVLNERSTFDKFFLNYGKVNAFNYLALIGKDRKDLETVLGYYGEMIVLEAQDLGLNTCWVSGTYSKREVIANIKEDERLVCIIAIGYGENQGIKRKSKSFKEVSYSMDVPDWYKKGIEYALLAPTAVNQQKFKFELIDNNKVRLTPGIGLSNIKIDLGIVKYHFELGADTKNFTWY